MAFCVNLLIILSSFSLCQKPNFLQQDKTEKNSVRELGKNYSLLQIQLNVTQTQSRKIENSKDKSVKYFEKRNSSYIKSEDNKLKCIMEEDNKINHWFKKNILSKKLKNHENEQKKKTKQREKSQQSHSNLQPSLSRYKRQAGKLTFNNNIRCITHDYHNNSNPNKNNINNKKSEKIIKKQNNYFAESYKKGFHTKKAQKSKHITNYMFYGPDLQQDQIIDKNLQFKHNNKYLLNNLQNRNDRVNEAKIHSSQQSNKYYHFLKQQPPQPACLYKGRLLTDKNWFGFIANMTLKPSARMVFKIFFPDNRFFNF